MKNLEATFQIVTPMFLGGADHQATTIRPSSIKGALRFWWRALNWSKHPNLQELHKEEARLFGAAASDNDGGGQGVFLMRVESSATKPANFTPQAGVQYLLGMGLYDFKKGLIRDALQEKQNFTLHLLFRPNTPEDDIKQINNALKAFELLGGLGSRTRHGFGSVAGTNLMNLEEYKKSVKDLLKTITAQGEPPFTAFSVKTRVDISITGGDALKLLDAVGREQQMYRSYGRFDSNKNKRIVTGDQEPEQNFEDDHNLILNSIKNNIKPTKPPERAIFGLPHNYFFSSIKEGRKQADLNYEKARRASPLFLHIHPLIDGSFIAVHILMPAKFLPNDAKITVDGTKVNPNPNWQVIHTYLNRPNFDAKGTIHGERNV